MTNTGKAQNSFSYSDRDISLARLDSPYIIDDSLKQAVDMAIYLQRPLLLQGEPGTGKTQLAKAIARQFGQDQNIVTEPLDREKYPLGYPYYEWFIKSTSRAQEGLYSYDSVARLRDVQLIRDKKTIFPTREQRDQLLARIQNPDEYIQYGPLGNAFREEIHRPVVLIDEIDKADIDFPNDLLRELEQSKFTVTETGSTVTAKKVPIMIITSNQERDLPDAFLRRCIFYYINFPSMEELERIAEAHFYNLAKNYRDLIVTATVKFMEIRTKGVKHKDGKKPGTSEYLDLIQYLEEHSKKHGADGVIEMINTLASNTSLLGILLKNKSDQEYYRRLPNE